MKARMVIRPPFEHPTLEGRIIQVGYVSLLHSRRVVTAAQRQASASARWSVKGERWTIGARAPLHAQVRRPENPMWSANNPGPTPTHSANGDDL